MRPRFLNWFGLAAGGYAALVGGAYALQRFFIYPAPRGAEEPVVPRGRLHKIANGARTVHALHVPAPEGAPTIVHFHGNGENLADQSALCLELSRAGLGVYAVEYPGYGLSRAYSANEETLYSDAAAALDYLRDDLGVTRERTVIQGQSLGTGVAVEMVRRGFGSRLILIAPFTSMTDMVRRAAPFLPAGFIVKDRYENHAKAPSILAPVLIVHGSDDAVVPVEMSQRLATIFPSARLYIAPGAGHNDLFVVDGPGVLSTIAGFAKQDGGGN